MTNCSLARDTYIYHTKSTLEETEERIDEDENGKLFETPAASIVTLLGLKSAIRMEYCIKVSLGEKVIA